MNKTINKTMRKALLSTLVCLSSTLSTTLYAQDFNTFLDNAKQAFADKDFELAKLELQDALKLVNEKASAVLGNTFPKAPEGWRVSDIKTTSNAMAGTEISRIYAKGEAKMTAKIIHNSPLIASYAAVFNNPMLMQGEKIRIGRDHAVLQMNDDGKSGELIYLVKGKYLIQIDGRNLANKQPLVELIKSWDIKTVKAMVAE